MMETILDRAQRTPLVARLRLPNQANAASWLIGFAAPSYLALRGGGYDTVLRDQVGIALWWIILLGALIGVLPARRPTHAQLLLVGAFVLFAAWTGFGALWSQNSEHTITELTRLSTYVAILTLGVLAVRSNARSALLSGIAAAIVTVAGLALLSRLHPAWFPANETGEFLAGARSRLNYPLNYWNALAAFTAMGVPLILHFASSARRLAVRALAAAALPVLVATVYLTFSRGGWIELAAGVLVYTAFTSKRLWRIATLAVAASASALFIAAIHQRPAVDKGLLNTTAAHHAGNELVVIGIILCVAVGLLQFALALVERHANRPQALADVLRPRAWQPIVIVLVAIIAFFALGGPHEVSHLWNEFKNPHLKVATSQQDSAARLNAASGEGRYQFWTAALHAFSSHPLGGIGAGTFQFWWAAHGSIYAYIINAHSLYMETLAETGLPGILLLAMLLLGGLAAMVSRWRGAPSRERALLAAILGGCAAFLVSAAFDWVWQIPALPAVLLLLIAAGTGNILKRPGKAKSFSPTTRMRVGWTALALLGALVIIVPMVSAVSVRESQAQASAQRLTPALQDARTASSWQPYAATPLLQQALVLERAGNFNAAAVKARKAAAAASTDWSTWLVLSRIEAERGNARGAVTAYRHARSLDPRDPIFKSK